MSPLIEVLLCAIVIVGIAVFLNKIIGGKSNG